MPRPKRLRKMDRPPVFSGFRPIGVKGRPINEIILGLDEYEALKLCDYDSLTQAQAAEIMGVSRPTLTRIYSSCRSKIASAIVEGRGILIQGGKIDFDDSWYRCDDCKTVFNDVTEGQNIRCPRCASTVFFQIGLEEAQIQKKQFFKNGTPGYCRCNSCGTRFSHQKGIPCLQVVCPSCNAPMSVETIGNESNNCIKWAIPCLGNDLDAIYNTRFGRSPFFMVLSGNELNFIENPFVDENQMVGLKVLGFLKALGVEGIVSGYFGKKVEELAISKSIKIFKVESENISVNSVINLLKSNNYAK